MKVLKTTNPGESYVYTLRLIGPISYPDECDLKDECPVDALRACVFIYLPYI